jgi:hypothetical protein
MTRSRMSVVAAMLLLWLVVPGAAKEPPTVGTTLPKGFPVVMNYYLGKPVLGFGAKGPLRRVPVIFLHGNNDTPFATSCNPYGNVHDFAQYFVDNGYRLSEVWGVGYQGDQCDLPADETLRSGVAHGTAPAVSILRNFVHAVMKYTGASHVDIVAHSLRVTVAREWMLQDNAYKIVRALVAVDGPNHGIVDCSPSTDNYWQQTANGGFTPNSTICDEYGSDQTQLLATLNGAGETPGPTRYLVVMNVAGINSGDFVYISAQDGVFPAVPAQDRNGNPHDFSESALLAGAEKTISLTGEGSHDPILGTAHLGILNSPDTWSAALAFIQSK